MAHFAQIDEDGTVLRVIRVPDTREKTGATFCRDVLGLGGRWVQTSFSGSIRRRFAAPGMRFDAGRDAFVTPQPYPSWRLDARGDWQPPIPCPETGDWLWDEITQQWRTLSGET
ncbi:MAG: hypothetical protein JXJ18_09590 [Rhodobacteraceae bacterium]|nr:hypothetical protein [Paracoccaceae bacterium]